jgi:hypothetical protein
MLKILSLFAVLFTVSCSTSQMADTDRSNLINSDKSTNVVQKVVNNPTKVDQKTLKSCALSEAGGEDLLRNLFNFEGVNIDTYKPEVDPDLVFLKKIRSCPREEMIGSILELQSTAKDDLEIKAKTTYLLLKLENNKSENGKILRDCYSEWRNTILERYKDPNYAENVKNNKYNDSIRGDQIMSLFCDVIENDDNDKVILSESFDSVFAVDGASATGLFETFATEFEKYPEKFLKAIKIKSPEVKEKVFGRMCYSIPKKEIIKDLSIIPKSSDVYSLSKEILELVKQSKTCEDAENENSR